MFSSRLPLSTLAEFCRSMRMMLEAGVTLPRVMRQQANKGQYLVRPVAGRLAERLEQGNDLESALEDEEKYFPTLFIDLVGVAENTGKLPEVLKDLEEFFTLQHKLKRDFISQITFPLIQFVLALMILSGLIILREFIPTIFDFTGMNLRGVGGALRFLSGFFGFFVILAAVYWLFSATLKRKSTMDGLLLKIPVIGGCLESFALSRFCLAFHLTAEAGLPVKKAIRLNLKATSNGAFEAASPQIETAVKRGEALSEALAEPGLFPESFLLIVETAEVSGQLPEVLRRQGQHYYEEAARRLRILASVLSKLVYLCVALFIIWALVKLYGGYFGALNEAMNF